MPTTKPATARVARTPGTTVTESMTTHSAAIKAKQDATRKAERPATTKAAQTAKAPTTAPDPRIAALVAWRSTATAATVAAEVLDVVEAAIKRGTVAPRQTMAKADPDVVAAFFASTGLTRKEIADAVGVSTSVIGTVQKQSGDRWSAARFEAAKPLILAAAEAAKAAKVEPPTE